MDTSAQKDNRFQTLVQDALTWLLAGALTIGLTLVLVVNPVQSTVSAELGQPASSDIFAPRDLSFPSPLVTEQRRQEARNAVSEQYTPLDLAIGRTQLSEARALFAFIETVRADTQATTETKLSYFEAVEGSTIEEEVGQALLTLSESEYAVAKADVLGIIDELMRQEIRDTQLSDFRRIARRQASLELTNAQNTAVTNLADQFIVSTVFPDLEATAVLRDEAAAAIEPAFRDIQEGQRIVRTGDLITELDVEALTALGLLQQETNWQFVGRMFLASLLTAVMIAMYWSLFHQRRQDGPRYAVALLGMVLFFALVGRLMIAGPVFLAYWYPLAAMSMLMAVVFDIRLAITATTILSGLIGYVAPNSLEIAMYGAVGGILATLTLRDAERITTFFRAGLVAAVGYMMVILIFRFSADVDLVQLAQLLLYALANGVLSAGLTLAGFFIMGSVFGLITTLQLQDLSRLDHPLLQELLRKAPGTYHHSIMVANLAEQAAETIPRVDSTLVRVGAFYHDIGKMNRPPFFTENQEGLNPHDTLDPYSSARIILSHVTDGLDMARKHRLPDRLRDFIAEHHGDRLLKGFYQKALDDAEESGVTVDEARFRYNGPRPRSPETGVVMLADSVEATSSALRPNTARAIEKLVNTIVDDHIMEGQLDNSELTLGDIQQVRDSFIKTLKGRFHVRVKYKGNEELMVDDSGEAPAVADTAVTVDSSTGDAFEQTDVAVLGDVTAVTAPAASEIAEETS